MKKIISLFILSSLILTGCDNFTNTSFKEYTEIVKNASESQKDIFIFTSSSCFHCQKLESSIERFITENTDEKLSIHQLSVVIP